MTGSPASRAEPRRVLVAGAGGGIGRAVALAFARTGANLVLTGRTRSSLEAVGAECADSPDVLVEPCDVSRPGDVERLMSSAVGAFGGIDVLVNAAGVHGAIGPVQECDPGEWMRGVEVNLFGSFLLARAVIPGMLERQVGRIVLFSGGGATSPLPMFSAYAASKAGIVRLAETLAEELRPSVQVNAIAPGIVDTTLLDAVLAAGARAGAEYEQVRRIRVGDTEPVPGELAAELVVFLATHASPSLTGRLISAPHDPWRGWGNGDSPEDGLYTLRRMDPHTLGPLMKALQ